ncbi:MAG TPA: universal stress protein [Rhodobacteraceae bacterium]|nr:universal stress protein [Paracoccaceae bacterium]
MKNATIFTLVGKDFSEDQLRPLIDSARADDAHLTVLALGATPQVPVYAANIQPYAAAILPDDWQKDFLVENAALTATAKEVGALLQREAVSGDVSVLNCEPSRIAARVARRAVVCDLCVLSPGLRAREDVFHPALQGVLFESPVAAVLNYETLKTPAKIDRVFVAWDSGLPSARAVQRAMAMLRQAREVTIGIFDPVMTENRDGENPGSELAEWLSRHGCNVRVNQYPSGGKEIGDCIVGRAKETGADLVVMGAYGHSRLREDLFGGTTRTMIEQRELAVLLAH